MISENWRRVVTLTQGVAMVVTDLHGDWDVYQLYRNLFVCGYEAGKIQYLIFTGDLIHRESAPERDKSLEIVLDVLALQEEYPNAVIYLCGNHELPHVYGVTLAKGDFTYTPSFEARLGEHRAKVIAGFRSLPFYVRTSAGVAITHAGAAASLSVDRNCRRIFAFDHQTVFDHVNQSLRGQNLAALRKGVSKLSGEPYQKLARNYLAVTGKGDPRYNDFLRGFIASSAPDFQLLWTVLFTRCEQEYGNADYAIFLQALLQALSAGFQPQNFLVAGHIKVRGGYKIIAERHLRIASGGHTVPLNSARYLVFDVAQPVQSAAELVLQLRSIYDS